MSCDYKPFIQTVNSAQADIPSDGSIPLGTVAHQLNDRHSCHQVYLEGSGIVCKGKGAFEVSGTISLAPVSGSGVVSVQVKQDNEVAAGSKSQASVGNVITLPVLAVVYNDTCSSSVVALENVGVEVNVYSTSLLARAI